MTRNKVSLDISNNTPTLHTFIKIDILDRDDRQHVSIHSHDLIEKIHNVKR